MAFRINRNSILFIITATAMQLAVAASTSPTTPSSKATAAIVTPAAKPYWVDLSSGQKQALAPLITEWDKMPEFGKKKWLEISNRYATMKPDEQARLQERMRDWVKLTPEQRMSARENFAKAKQVKPEQKSVQWQQYQQLSEEEKKHLAAEHNKKKSLTNLSTDALKNQPGLAPIKVGPKPTTTAPISIKPVAPTVVPPTVMPAPAAASGSLAPEPAIAPGTSSASQTVVNK